MNTPPQTMESSEAEPKVLVVIPRMYVNVDESGEHRSAAQFVLLPYNKIMEFGKLLLRVENENSYSDQLRIQSDLIAQIVMLLDKEKNSGNFQIEVAENDRFEAVKKIIKTLLLQMNSVCEQSSNFMTLDAMNRLENTPIAIHNIRKYVNRTDEPSLLESFTETSYKGRTFYGLLTPEETLECRRLNNDTDLNRFHYISKLSIDSLLFKDKRISDSTIKMFNVVLVYLLMNLSGEKYEGHYEEDTILNLLGYMIDLGIRTRLIQKYVTTDTKYDMFMRNNVNKAYGGNRNNFLVNLCKLKTARDRIAFSLQLMNKSKAMQASLNIEAFDEYCSVLNQSVIKVDEKESYYNFNMELIQKFVEMRCFEVLCTLIPNKVGGSGGEENIFDDFLDHEVLETLKTPPFKFNNDAEMS